MQGTLAPFAGATVVDGIRVVDGIIPEESIVSDVRLELRMDNIANALQQLLENDRVLSMGWQTRQMGARNGANANMIMTEGNFMDLVRKYAPIDSRELKHERQFRLLDLTMREEAHKCLVPGEKTCEINFSELAKDDAMTLDEFASQVSKQIIDVVRFDLNPATATAAQPVRYLMHQTLMAADQMRDFVHEKIEHLQQDFQAKTTDFLSQQLIVVKSDPTLQTSLQLQKERFLQSATAQQQTWEQVALAKILYFEYRLQKNNIEKVLLPSVTEAQAWSQEIMSTYDAAHNWIKQTIDSSLPLVVALEKAKQAKQQREAAVALEVRNSVKAMAGKQPEPVPSTGGI